MPPRRTDLKSILVIGSGPIVIGQACEFDYSGTQACRVLREEGFRVVLVNSNPATIMTDPDMADATYVEPITPEFVEKVIAKERPDALLATLGGQTALNTAVRLHEAGILEKYGVELIGASIEAIQRGGEPGGVQGDRHRPGRARRSRGGRPLGDLPQHGRGAGRGRVSSATRSWSGPASPWGGGRLRLRAHRGTAAHHRGDRPGRLPPGHRGADRGVDHGLEGIRARGDARRRRQRRRGLLDRELRPDGHPHRRLDHRRPRR